MAQKEKNEALFAAVSQGDLEAVKKLIASGAQADAKNYFGNQPLHHAAWHGHLPVVEYFIEERGAQVDAKDKGDDQPLHHAAGSGCLSVVKYLVGERGARADVKNNADKTPSELAGNHPEIQKFLQEWASPEKAEKRRWDGFGKMAAGVIARQRQLGSLRQKGPTI